MKSLLFTMGWIIISSGTITNQPTLDYISSGYYQLIYETDIAYLSEDKESAYNKLCQAESLCPLIEQPRYYEISRYIELLCEHNQFEKAKNYVIALVRDYGYAVNQIEKEKYFQDIDKNIDWKILRPYLDSLNKAFYAKVDTTLVNEIKHMRKKDQEVRKGWNEKHMEAAFQERMHQVDSLNEKRIKEIFTEYGYPNERLLGHANILFGACDITAMLMHFEDTTYFKATLLKFIQRGECPPEALANFVDSRCRAESRTDKYIYGVYTNTPKEQIRDYENLDNRRLSIGMPTMEIQHKKDSLVKIKYGFSKSK